MYEIGEPQRLAARDKISTWLDREDLKRIVVERIRNGRQTQVRGSDIFPEVIEHMPEPRDGSVLEAILLAHGDLGGTIQIRAEFLPTEDGKTPSDQRFRIGLSASSPGTKTGSKGADAAAEALAGSMQKMNETLRGSHDELTGRLVEVLQGHNDRQEGTLRNQMEMTHTYNAEILRLQLQVTELKGEIRLMEFFNEQQTDPSQWAGLLKDLIPVAGDAIGNVVRSWQGSPAAVAAPDVPENGAGAPESAPPEAPA